MDKIRAAAYCRVSTDTSDQANSLESQRLYFEQYIKSRTDYVLTEIYCDSGISGTMTTRREGFNRMIDDALRGEIDCIITKEVSRFARNTIDTLAYTRMLKEKGVGVYFTIDNINTLENDGELRLTIMASIAQEESRKISERVKWGQKRRMEQGVVFGRDLFGYTVKNGSLRLNPDEAETVRLIFRKFLDEGKGTHVIARELNETKISSKHGGKWSGTVILRMLRNAKYVGDLCQKKTFTPDYLTHKKKYNMGDEETIYIKDHHEAIIDRHIWDHVQNELARRKETAMQKSKYSGRYPYSGKLVCGECGRSFVSRTKKLHSGDIYKAWRCCENALHGKLKTDTDGNRIGCSSSSVNDKTLTEAAAYCLKLVYNNFTEIRQAMLKEIEHVSRLEPSANTERLEKELEKLQRKKERVIELTLDGTLTKEELTEQKTVLNRKIYELSEKITASKSAFEAQRIKTADAEAYAGEIERIMLMKTENTALYGSLLSKIIVCRDKKLIVYFKGIPFGIKLVCTTYGRGGTYRAEFEVLCFVHEKK